MSAGRKITQDLDLDDLPQRLSDITDSLCSVSIRSSDFSRSDAAEHLHKQRTLALESLSRPNLTSLPSRFLKPSSSPASDTCFLHSESTISESDLLGNSSTPRSSVLSNLENVMQKRLSFKNSMYSMIDSLKNPDVDISELQQMCKSINSEHIFRSGEEAVAALEQDEISWQREKHIPAQMTEFSADDSGVVKVSMGMFFKERSDDLSKLLAKSPEKTEDPVPLIETTLASEVARNNGIDQHDKTLSVSYIAKILSDTKQTPSRAVDHLLNVKRKSDVSNVEPELKKLNDVDQAMKENVDSLNIRSNASPDFPQNRSMLSSRTSSSLSSLPNGRLPIATTKTELIWGCIKPGKNVTHEFIICNRSGGRIGIQCSVSNPSFRLIKEGSELNFSSKIKIILHPYQSRSVTVTFAPTNLGAAADVVKFTSLDSNHEHKVKQYVKLFGYGGHGNVTINNIIKDVAGKFLLSLGTLEDQQIIKKSFSISNSGTLPVFGVLAFVSSSLYSFSSIKVIPQAMVLLPGEEREVVVTYIPQKDDFNYIRSKMNAAVTDIGKLTVIHGTEVDRGRLRRLYENAKEKGLEVNGALYDLTEKFSGEVMPKDLKLLRETAASLGEILRLFNSKEILITVEQDLDHTLTTRQFEDETTMYFSLCEETKFGIGDNTVYMATCHVEPSNIILKPPDKCKDMIFITNKSSKKLYFEVSCTPEGLSFKPRRGAIHPNETSVVDVEFSKISNENAAFKVKITVEHDSFEVGVKIMLSK